MKANSESNKTPQIISYFDNYRGITFLNDLFKKHPDLFETSTSINKHSDCCGGFVFYLLYSGQVVKASCLFDEFELFMKNSNPNIMKALMSNPYKIYSEGLNIISWARYLKDTCTFCIYEPILKLNDIVLQTFLQTRKFIYNDKDYYLEDIRPLAFTNVGENITDLLPYIAYLYNFLINCSPYEFNSVANGNVQTVYTQAINQYFESAWMKLIKNYPMLKIETFYSSLDNDTIFNIVNKEDIRALLKDILEPSNILEIRNSIIENNPDILSACVKDQLMISQEDVLQGFHEVFTRLVDIVIKCNPFTKLLDSIPYFANFNPSLDITYRLVEWSLCGSDTPFLITDSFEFIPLQKYQKKYERIPKMKIETDIQKNILCGNSAFLLSDPAQQIIIGYIIKELNDVLNDVMNDTDSLKPSVCDTNELIESQLFNIYINGLFAKHNSVLSEQLKHLSRSDIIILESLSNSLNKFYNNQFSSNIIRSYIFSFYPEYLLKFCNTASKHNITSTKSFSSIVYYCLHSEIDNNKINNLLNLEYALMCVHNRHFCNIVNMMSNKITSVILHNSYIFQPYVMKTTNSIHEYTLGGITLCQKSIITNALVRAIEFIRYTRGTTEELECFLEWIKRLDNEEINDTLEDFLIKKDINTIKNILVSRFNTLSSKSSKNNIYNCLEGFIFENNKFRKRNDIYFYTDSLLNEISKYCFEKQLAKNIQAEELYWRPLRITTNSISTTFPSKNKFFIDKIECTSYIMENGEYSQIPIIKYNSEIETISIIYQPPQGLKVIKIISPSGSILENNVFFIFTNAKVSEEWISKDTSYEENNRMILNGVNMKINPNTR